MSKINNVLINNAENLDVVMLIYNLIEYIENYKKTTGNLRNYYRNEPKNHPLNDDDPLTVNYNPDPITNFASFEDKCNITGKTLDNDDDNDENNNRKKTKDVEIVALLKHLRNFWKTLDTPLINYGISLVLTWSEMCFN